MRRAYGLTEMLDSVEQAIHERPRGADAMMKSISKKNLSKAFGEDQAKKLIENSRAGGALDVLLWLDSTP